MKCEVVVQQVSEALKVEYVLPPGQNSVPTVHLMFLLDATGSMSCSIHEIKNNISQLYDILQGLNICISLIVYRDFDEVTASSQAIQIYFNVTTAKSMEQILARTEATGGGASDSEAGGLAFRIAAKLHETAFGQQIPGLLVNISDELLRYTYPPPTPFRPRLEPEFEREIVKALQLEWEVDLLTYLAKYNFLYCVTLYVRHTDIFNDFFKSNSRMWNFKVNNNNILPATLELMYYIFVRRKLTPDEEQVYKHPNEQTKTELQIIEEWYGLANWLRGLSMGPECDISDLQPLNLTTLHVAIRFKLQEEDNRAFIAAIVRLLNESTSNPKLNVGILAIYFHEFRKHPATKHEMELLLSKYTSPNCSIRKMLTRDTAIDCTPLMPCSRCVINKQPPEGSFFVYVDKPYRQLARPPFSRTLDYECLKEFIDALVVSADEPDLPINTYRTVRKEYLHEDLNNIYDLYNNHVDCLLPNSRPSYILLAMLKHDAKFEHLPICVMYDKIFDTVEVCMSITATRYLDYQELPPNLHTVIQTASKYYNMRLFDFFNERVVIGKYVYFELLDLETSPNHKYCADCKISHHITKFYNLDIVEGLDLMILNRFAELKKLLKDKSHNPSGGQVCIFRLWNIATVHKKEAIFYCSVCGMLYSVDNYANITRNGLPPKCLGCQEGETDWFGVCKLHGTYFTGIYRHHANVVSCPLCYSNFRIKPYDVKPPNPRIIDLLTEEELSQIIEVNFRTLPSFRVSASVLTSLLSCLKTNSGGVKITQFMKETGILPMLSEIFKNGVTSFYPPQQCYGRRYEDVVNMEVHDYIPLPKFNMDIGLQTIENLYKHTHPRISPTEWRQTIETMATALSEEEAKHCNICESEFGLFYDTVLCNCNIKLCVTCFVTLIEQHMKAMEDCNPNRILKDYLIINCPFCKTPYHNWMAVLATFGYKRRGIQKLRTNFSMIAKQVGNVKKLLSKYADRNYRVCNYCKQVKIVEDAFMEEYTVAGGSSHDAVLDDSYNSSPPRIGEVCCADEPERQKIWFCPLHRDSLELSRPQIQFLNELATALIDFRIIDVVAQWPYGTEEITIVDDANAIVKVGKYELQELLSNYTQTVEFKLKLSPIQNCPHCAELFTKSGHCCNITCAYCHKTFCMLCLFGYRLRECKGYHTYGILLPVVQAQDGMIVKTKLYTYEGDMPADMQRTEVVHVATDGARVIQTEYGNSDVDEVWNPAGNIFGDYNNRYDWAAHDLLSPYTVANIPRPPPTPDAVVLPKTHVYIHDRDVPWRPTEEDGVDETFAHMI